MRLPNQPGLRYTFTGVTANPISTAEYERLATRVHGLVSLAVAFGIRGGCRIREDHANVEFVWRPL